MSTTARSTAIDRVLNFYRTASHDTVRVTHQLAEEIIAERGIGRKVKGTGAKRTRKSKDNATSQTGVATGAGSGGN